VPTESCSSEIDFFMPQYTLPLRSGTDYLLSFYSCPLTVLVAATWTAKFMPKVLLHLTREVELSLDLGLHSLR
jgi:hypothetical protein